MSSIELSNLREDVFGMCLTVLVGEPEEYTKWLDDVGFKGGRLAPESRKAIWQDLRPSNMEDGETDSEFIWLRSKDLGSLAHELIHLTTKMFHDKDIPIGHENDEVLCYYVEYWFNRINQAWNNPNPNQYKVKGDKK